MKENRAENIIDIEKLKQIYEDSMEYLQNQKELADFKTKLEQNAESYKKKMQKEGGFEQLEKQAQELLNKLNKYDDLKSDGRDNGSGACSLFGEDFEDDYYPDEDDEFGFFTEQQIDDYFETQKKFQLLKRKILKEEKRVNDLHSDYSDNQKEEYKNQIKQLEEKVLESGFKVIDFEFIKNQEGRKYELDKMKEMLFANEYKPVFKGEWAEDAENADYSAELMQWNNNLDVYFGNITANIKITTDKLSKNYPSTFEYFVKKLEEHTGKKYKRVNLVTNQTGCWHDHYEPDDYYVYCASLLLPENLAEAFVMSEKKQTSQKIHDFLEKHNEVILLCEKDIVYYTQDYHPKWGGSRKELNAEYKRYKDATKFDDTYREEVREKLLKDEKTNVINIEKMFSVKDDSSFISGEKIVGKLPAKEVANAMFDTIEYAQKLTKLSKLEKIVEKQKVQEDATKEYEELVKQM